MAEIAVEPGSAGFDSPLGEFYDQLVQSCIRRAPHKLAHQRVMGGKLVFAIPTHALRYKAACRLGMLHQLDHGAGRHIEPLGDRIA